MALENLQNHDLYRPRQGHANCVEWVVFVVSLKHDDHESNLGRYYLMQIKSKMLFAHLIDLKLARLLDGVHYLPQINDSAPESLA